MLNLQIEKEVETKHTVFFNWTLRQCVCIAVAGGLTGLFIMVGHLDVYGIALVAAPFGFLAYLIGWKETAGLRIEEVGIKVLQRILYRNQSRSYRTRNGYVTLMNEAYGRMRNADLADKKTAKMVESQKKREAAKKTRSKYKAII